MWSSWHGIQGARYHIRPVPGPFPYIVALDSGGVPTHQGLPPPLAIYSCCSPSVGRSRTVLELPAGYGGSRQVSQASQSQGAAPSASFVRDRAAFVRTCKPVNPRRRSRQGSEVLRRSSHAASRSHRRNAPVPRLRRCGGRRSERRSLSAPPSRRARIWILDHR